jgi:predicted  nucleic acid-binding Zn-ribbon protein
MTMNVEAEFRDLKRRVSVIENSFVFLTQHMKAFHKDLLAFQARTEQRLGKLDGRLDMVERRIRDLREDMPGIVRDARRTAPRKRRRKAKARKTA